MSEPAGLVPEEWRRTSPLSFAVRAVTGLKNLLFPAAALLFGTGAIRGGALWVFPAIVGMVLFSALFTWIAWRHFRYRLGDDDIRVEHGLFNRTARSVPYERIQDVSLEQKLVPRLFGMVEVKFETGAGGKDELRISYVSESEAAALREVVRARKTDEVVLPRQAVEPAAAPARTLFAMGLQRLLTFGLFEFSLVVFAVLGGAAEQLDFLLPFDLWDMDAWGQLLAGPGHRLAALGPAAQAVGIALALVTLGLLGLITGLTRTVLRDYGFRLEETPKGLRRRRGLLTRTDVVMPLHRVQALRVTTGIVRRRFGWHGLQAVSLAQDAKSESHVIVPFATMEEIASVVDVTDFALPGESVEWHKASSRYRFDNALIMAVPLLLATLLGFILRPWVPDEVPFSGMLPVGVLVVLTVFFSLREFFLWRHDRHTLDSAQIYVRRGWLAPRLDIAHRVKLQSVEIVQGPIARRRGYADLKFGVAGGTLEIEGIPLAGARAIREAILDSIATVDFSRLPRRASLLIPREQVGPLGTVPEEHFDVAAPGHDGEALLPRVGDERLD